MKDSDENVHRIHLHFLVICAGETRSGEAL